MEPEATFAVADPPSPPRATPEPRWWPVFGMVEVPGAVVVTGLLRELDPATLEVALAPDHATVSGRRRGSGEDPAGAFSVTILFPNPIEPDRAFVEGREGILAMLLPKRDPARAAAPAAA